jgi:hypothetical protein
MTEDAGSGDPRLPRAITFVAGTNYTLSVFAKVKPGSAQRYLMLVYNSGYANIHGVNFDLVAGTVGATFNASGTITALPDGWYRVSMTPNANATGAGSLRIRISNVNTSGNINVPTPYTGDGASGFILWQAQVETGSVATSPIVTVASTVARSADAVSLTGASSLIGQTEGYVAGAFVAGAPSGASFRTVFSLGIDANNAILARLDASNQLDGLIVSGGVAQASFTSSALVAGTTYGFVLSYSAGATLLSLNGAQVGTTDTSATIPANTRVDIGQTVVSGAQLNGHSKALVLGSTAQAIATANALSLSLSQL